MFEILALIQGNLVTPGCADESGRGNYECGTTDFIKEVKTHGLKVHAFTFRNEWMKLYWDHGQDPYRYAKYFVTGFPRISKLVSVNWRSFTS